MIVTCPACATRFLLDPAALGPSGRTVRCARCAETWHQDPPPPEAGVELRPAESDFAREAEAAADRDEPLPDDTPSFMTRAERLGDERGSAARLPALPPTGRRFSWIGLGWIGLVLAVVILLGVGYVGRDGILAAWPQTARLYRGLGLAPEPIGAGLQVRGLNSARTVENGTQTLVLAGQIANISDRVRPIPPLHGVLKNAENKVLTTWSFSATRAQLLPGETTPFTTSVANPVPEATAAFVEFGPAP